MNHPDDYVGDSQSSLSTAQVKDNTQDSAAKRKTDRSAETARETVMDAGRARKLHSAMAFVATEVGSDTAARDETRMTDTDCQAACTCRTGRTNCMR
ncbi:TPA: hypothetical protein HA251_07830 [Candidatus Woesearchaeota archaeon]|nr:hypothetical protein [Candidatus Woesearchaeota archaeon]